jgi:PleD family two-component response regulator
MSRQVIAAVDDMFFASKIRATAQALGVEISFPRTKEALVQKLKDLRPAMLLVDLQNQRIDPVALATEVKADVELSEVKLLGFFSHVEVELQRSALAAGYDRVVPRSVFAANLAGILTGDG